MSPDGSQSRHNIFQNISKQFSIARFIIPKEFKLVHYLKVGINQCWTIIQNSTPNTILNIIARNSDYRQKLGIHSDYRQKPMEVITITSNMAKPALVDFTLQCKRVPLVRILTSYSYGLYCPPPKCVFFCSFVFVFLFPQQRLVGPSQFRAIFLDYQFSDLLLVYHG